MIGSTLLDSGAHSLYTAEVLNKGAGVAMSTSDAKRVIAYAYYETDEFWDYVDRYGEFLAEYGDYLDGYVTVDVIFNPELSWKVQRYLEDQYKVTPLPVLHWGTGLEWFKKYLKEGHEYLGLGGLGQEVSRWHYCKWADDVFEYLCQGNKGRPNVKTHGFAMISLTLLNRYPWESVDSATWIKLAGYGKIMIPHYRQGRWVYDFADKPSDYPYIMSVSNESLGSRTERTHYGHLRPEEKKIIRKWFDYVGVSYEDEDSAGRSRETDDGLAWQHYARSLANIRFFTDFQKHLTDNPVVFRKRTNSFGITL